MKHNDQKLIWEAYLTELVGDPDDQKHGIPAARNIDADRRAAETRGPDPNIPKHGQSDANASDYDPNDSWQNKMRQAVQDLEDLETNYTWGWTDEGGLMDWLVKRLDFFNARDENGRPLWDGTDSSMPEELQRKKMGKVDGEQLYKDKDEVIELLKDKIIQALWSSTRDGTYANPKGGSMNPTDLGQMAVKGIFDNGDSIRRFYNHWKGKREGRKEPGTDAVTGGVDSHGNPRYRLD